MRFASISVLAMLAACEGGTNRPSDELPSYAVTVHLGGGGHGIVSGDTPAGRVLDCNIVAGALSGGCSAMIDSGTTLQLSAAPQENSAFLGWGNDAACQTSTICSVQVTHTLSITATFEVPEKPIPRLWALYGIQGYFDNYLFDEAHFLGSVTLTEEVPGSGILGGSARIGGRIRSHYFKVVDDSLEASVSPTGVISFTLATGGPTTWTFTGTKTPSSNAEGRHTLHENGSTYSGTWRGTQPSAVVAP